MALSGTSLRITGFATRRGGLESPGPLKLTYIGDGHLNPLRAECVRSFYRELHKYAKLNFTESFWPQK